MEKNLQEVEGIKKFKQLIQEINVAMMITGTGEDQTTRPMYTIDVDDQGSLWFFTDKNSLKIDEVNSDNHVHLLYAHPGKDSYLDVKGTARVISDKKLIEEKYKTIVKAWFSEGKDDPALCLLKVTPNQAHYWDSNSNKLMEGIQIIASIFTGKKLVDGDEGDIKI